MANAAPFPLAIACATAFALAWANLRPAGVGERMGCAAGNDAFRNGRHAAHATPHMQFKMMHPYIIKHHNAHRQSERTRDALELASRHGRGRAEEDQEDKGLEVHGDQVSRRMKKFYCFICYCRW